MASLSDTYFKDPKFKALGLVFLGIVAVSLAIFLPNTYQFEQTEKQAEKVVVQKPQNSLPEVKINDLVIPVEIVQTAEAIQKGLSGRSSLPVDQGMLFLFPKPSIYRFWMPDMYFSIDIIWINNGIVVDTDENLSTDFDRENPVFYTPNVPARQVLEVNAGFVKANKIKKGDRVSLPSNVQ